jgi:hypothetical protein
LLVALTEWRKKRRLQDEDKRLSEMSSVFWDIPEGASQEDPGTRGWQPSWLHEGTRRAVESLIEELRERAKKELEENSSKFIEQTRQRMQEEIVRAMEIFSEEARKTMADKIAPSIQEDVEKSLRKSAAELLATLTASMREQVENTCRNAVNVAVDSINVAAGEAVTAIDGRQKHFVPELQTTAGVPLREEKNSADAALEELQRKSDALLGNLQAQVQETVDGLRKKDLKTALGHINQTAEDLVEHSGRQLQQLADDTLKATVEKLNSFAQRLIEQTAERPAEQSRMPASERGQDAPGVHRSFVPAPRQQPDFPPVPYSVAPVSRVDRVRGHSGGLDLAKISRVCLWATAAAVPIFLLVCLAVHPVMRLRTEPPVEFFGVSPGWDAKRRAGEEHLARAYWDRAARYIQWKYQFGTSLPEEPPPEFNVPQVGPSGKNSRADIENRVQYWRRLRRVWLLPEAWEKSYEWNSQWGWNRILSKATKE